MTLADLITRVYNVRHYQVIGPAWINQDRYDVIAKLPPGATQEQSNIMLRNLLADRFHLTLRHETKEFQDYELTVGNGGHRMKESSPEDAAPDRPGMLMMARTTGKGIRTLLIARAQTMSQLQDAIDDAVNRPVIDKTGLTGNYDFRLDFMAATLGDALHEQLGLRIEEKKIPLEALIVVTADKVATEN